jgi:hypothetical protein
MRDHGTRAKYVFEKCRCEPCSDANRTYARERERHQRRVSFGIEEPRVAYIDATEARDHLRWLRKVGVGKRQVHVETGLSVSAIDKIRSGRVTKCREATANKILAVGRSKAADGAYIDAKATWRLIDDLRKHGWTKTSIARALGSTAKTPVLQIGRKRVTAKKARAVKQLYDREMFRIVEGRRMASERAAKYRQLAREAA